MKELTSSVSPDSILADTPDGTPVRIDFKQLIGEHTLVAAQNGYSKSVLLRKSKELALAVGYPMIVLDSDGEMASLRDAAPNGILVAGGEHADPGVTIEETIRRLPQIVAARASLILDIHDLDTEQQASVVARVLTMLMKLPQDLQQPYLVVIDEVQRFASQRGTSKASNAIIRVAKEGRKRGITLMAASQRVADVSKALTSQMKNRLFGHMSDLVDRKRVGDEIGLNSRQSLALAEFDRGDFLIRGEAFGGPLDRVRVRKPITGKLGKDHMIAKLKLPISPIEEVYALFGKPAVDAVTPATTTSGPRPRGRETTRIVAAMVEPLTLESDVIPLEAVLLEVLAPHGRVGLHKDSLALLAGTTERRGSFQEAFSSLLARRLVSVGTGAKVRITPEGLAAVELRSAAMTVFERLAALRGKREPVDERVVACLSAAGHVAIDVEDIRTRTGLGPRVLKAALKRLKRDCWVVERRGSFATAPALARLIGR